MMNDEAMRALEERLLNNPLYENQLFPDVEIIEDLDDLELDESELENDIDSELNTNDLDQLWKGF